MELLLWKMQFEMMLAPVWAAALVLGAACLLWQRLRKPTNGAIVCEQMKERKRNAGN